MNSIREAVRQINMELSDSKFSKKIAFVTTNHSNSQPTVIANLAMMNSRADRKIVIVNTDFSSEVFEKAFEIKSGLGLSDYLDENAVTMDDVVNKVSGQNLAVVTSGTLKQSDTKFLVGDPRYKKLIDNLSEKFDQVMINAPFRENEENLKSILEYVDGVIIVIDLNETKKKELLGLIDFCKKIDVNVLGYISAEKK